MNGDSIVRVKRAYPLILNLARTIADQDNSGKIRNTHLAEALQYRPQVMY